MLFNATIWRRENTMSNGAPYYAVEPKKQALTKSEGTLVIPQAPLTTKKTPPSAVSRRRSRPKHITSQHSPTPPAPKPQGADPTGGETHREGAKKKRVRGHSQADVVECEPSVGEPLRDVSARAMRDIAVATGVTAVPLRRDEREDEREQRGAEEGRGAHGRSKTG